MILNNLLQSFKQVKGFYFLFATEMWERYGFYVVQTLLIFYLLHKLTIADAQAYSIVSKFTALAYINCVFGGLIADKLIGIDKAVILGGVLLLIAYIMLAISKNLHFMTISLSLITVATGLLKPNISSMLSILHNNKRSSDSNKYSIASAYTLYYIGLYIGVLLGSLCGGYIKQFFGFEFAFFSAAFVMCLALGIFVIGRLYYKLIDDNFTTRFTQLSAYSVTLIMIITLFTISYLVLHYNFLGELYFIIMACLSGVYLLYNIIRSSGVQKIKYILFSILIILAVFYWAIYFQQFLSFSVYIDRFSKISLPVSAMSSIEALGVIVFGFILNAIWQYFASKNIHINIFYKFIIALICNSIAILFLIFSIILSIKLGLNFGLIMICVIYIILAIGEISISPASLYMVHTLIPKNQIAIMTGISLLSIGFGAKLAGVLSLLTTININGIVATKAQMLDLQLTYLQSFVYYLFFSIASIILAMIIICKSKNLKQLLLNLKDY